MNEQKIYETRNKISIDYENMKAMNFRLPADLKYLIEKDIINYKELTNTNISLNEYLIILIVQGGPYRYSHIYEQFMKTYPGEE